MKEPDRMSHPPCGAAAKATHAPGGVRPEQSRERAA